MQAIPDPLSFSEEVIQHVLSNIEFPATIQRGTKRLCVWNSLD